MSKYNIEDTTIWHLGHLPVEYLDYILKRYKQHSNDSIIHNQQLLDIWRDAHLFGKYPTREINPLELPKQIIERYEINKDRFYFATRTSLEIKHFLMVHQWLMKFNPVSVLDIGCGFGLYGYAMKIINNKIQYTGVEKSKYVGKHWNNNIGDLINEDIKNVSINKQFDLVLFVDVLEHLTYEDLDIVLQQNCNRDSVFIFSIPFIGDPNLNDDNTHIIKESKEWWINKLSQYFTIREVPKEWLFSQQLLLGKRK
jgi:2-polyprenyl-3-methyl-5-hydroxy-6-metoxy-1,4-benzoquinol methylase